MRLVRNPGRILLRSYSQQVNMLSLAAVGAYGALPEKLQDALPSWLVVALAVSLLLLGIVGRLIEQPELRSEDAERKE